MVDSWICDCDAELQRLTGWTLTRCRACGEGWMLVSVSVTPPRLPPPPPVTITFESAASSATAER